jgi:hypothetical protein
MHVSPIQAILFVVGIVAVLYILLIVWAREKVKQDLFGKEFRPISIRWHPCAYWSRYWRRATCFNVIFEDASGSVRKGRCVVRQDWRWVIHVLWVGDDVVYLQKNLPLPGRLAYVAIAGFFVQYGIRSLLKGASIYQAWRRWPWSPPPIVIRGSPSMFLSLAAICAACCLLSHVISHYDRGNHDRSYSLTARTFSLAGWALFWAFVGVLCYQQFKPLLYPAPR